jgi:hypothetical protein
MSDDGINTFLHQGFPFEVRLSQPSLAGSDGQTINERLAHIRSLAGKYKDCTFSTQRLFEKRKRENAK